MPRFLVEHRPDGGPLRTGLRTGRRTAVGLLFGTLAWTLVGASAWWGAGRASTASGADVAIEFNRDVRPILADKCFHCHGPDKNRREADLRLDTAAGLVGAPGAGGAVVPGKPDDSELMRRITSVDPERQMPPPDSGKQLSADEIGVLRKWIESGARWEGHWAFEPLKRTAPPVVPGADARNPIDAFVLDELSRRKLPPAPSADPVTLVRRLSFDLRGLPPSAEEVERFVRDPSDATYESLVDAYLQSTQYGERMAMGWLDLVRYADSVGYHGDQPVSVFPFRQYVIDSFNANKPFDQFTLEQLAGDLLPNPTLEQQIASGYNRLGMMSAEGGVQPKEYLAKYVAERVRNVSGAWLGLTLGCAECHDHKYDPFTSRDFYRMQAFFADIEERGLYSGAHASGEWGPTIKTPTAQQAAELAALDARIAQLRQTLDTPTPELAAAQAAWEPLQTAWQAPAPATVESAGKVKLTAQPDGSWLASGENPPTDVYTLTYATVPAGVTAVRVEVLPDGSLPRQGPGRASNGNFVLTEVVLKVRPAEGEPTSAALQNATATYEQTGAANGNPYGKWSAAGAIDGDAKGPGWGWAVMEQVGRPQAAVFETQQDLTLPAGAKLTVELHQKHENSQHTIGRFRVSFAVQARPVRADQGVPLDVAQGLAVPAAQRTAEQSAKLAAYYRSIAPALEPQRKELTETQARRTALDKTVPTTLVTRSVPPRPIRILPRGNWMSESGELCEPGFPEALWLGPPSSNQRLTRVDLARWLVSPDNRLTARTFVNRQWKTFFGAGLSRRLDDLGAQGEPPSHPLLLDWLAADFIESGWNVKRLVKQIVLSSTYRRQSLDTPALREIDPQNRWLARQSSFRLDAELVRDNALWISGLLVDRVGGPSVKPYQPAGYWAYLNFPQREWQNGRGDELYRRGLYTHWQRQYLHPSLLAFDAPSREECSADRPRSNTPLQSLVLLNDPSYVEAARVFAQRALETPDLDDARRAAWMWRRALSRAPEAAEVETLLKLLQSHRDEYRGDVESARQLIAVGAAPPAAGLDPAELAAWTDVARVLLNLHETITRY